jgi:hypothetical protein
LGVIHETQIIICHGFEFAMSYRVLPGFVNDPLSNLINGLNILKFVFALFFITYFTITHLLLNMVFVFGLMYNFLTQKYIKLSTGSL